MAVRAPLAPADLEPFRRELTGYCYRMLGSGFEAEDAVQETMLRAWRHADDFEGRSSVRSWLYRIATNVCIDMHRQVQRRARPMDMGPSSPPDESHLGPLLPEATWVTPIADAGVAPERGDPAEIAQYRDSIRLAFVAALQHLPARQRAALILCEVLRWPAASAGGSCSPRCRTGCGSCWASPASRSRWATRRPATVSRAQPSRWRGSPNWGKSRSGSRKARKKLIQAIFPPETSRTCSAHAV